MNKWILYMMVLLLERYVSSFRIWNNDMIKLIVSRILVCLINNELGCNWYMGS